MLIKYLGPSDEVIVAPYGPHKKDAVKEYPDDFGAELLASSKKQKFEEVEAEPTGSLAMSAKDAIAAIKNAGSVMAVVNLLSEGEDRKSVIEAAEARTAQLNAGE